MGSALFLPFFCFRPWTQNYVFDDFRFELRDHQVVVLKCYELITLRGAKGVVTDILLRLVLLIITRPLCGSLFFRPFIHNRGSILHCLLRLLFSAYYMFQFSTIIPKFNSLLLFYFISLSMIVFLFLQRCILHTIFTTIPYLTRSYSIP